MWKGKPNSIKPANLCNDFLISYLLKKKSSLEKIGMQRKSFVYHAAIQSIKKYPLPIISSQQLKVIYGIGQLLCDQLTLAIKHHYRDFLKKNKGKISQVSENDINAQQISQASLNKSNSKSVSNFESNSMGSGYIQEDSCRSYSIKSANIEREYRPRPKSLAAYIMVEIKKQGKGDYVTEQILKQNLRKQYNQNTGKQFTLAISNLIKYAYIKRDQLDIVLVKLTQKGITEVEKLQNKAKIKDSQAKIQGMLNSFKERQIGKACQEKSERNVRQLIETRCESKLVLVIDSRQIKDKQEQCFFQTRLQDKHGIVCRSANLPLGDFIWLYDGKVLDYIVERKKADDLISSIHDGRYKEQKYRLKKSGFTNIYYLFEGHLTGSNAVCEREVASALLKTMVKDAFKIVQVQSISESIKFLHFMTESIRNQICSSTQICTLGSLEQFTASNAKSSNLTIQHIFGLSLKTLPGVGKSSVNEILKYFSSLRALYNQLQLLRTRLQRVEFLRELLKGCGVQKSVPQLLVDILFAVGQK